MSENKRRLSQLDFDIITTAMNEFITRGIDNTDMKEIAKIVGISRTTLYRHFPNKDNLASYVTSYTLTYMQNLEINFTDDMNGYEKLSVCAYAYYDFYKKNPTITQYLAEYDLRFSDVAAPNTYVENIVFDDVVKTNKDAYTDPAEIFLEVINEGQKDGSIVNEQPARMICFTMLNAIKGMATSVVLRKDHLQNEQGYGIEMMDYFVELLLRSLKK